MSISITDLNLFNHFLQHSSFPHKVPLHATTVTPAAWFRRAI